MSGVHGPADRGVVMPWVAVSPDYFETLGAPLLQGRVFTAADTSETPLVAVVSEALADRYWSVETAVGQRLRFGDWDGPEYEIVGVSADYKVRFPTEEASPYIHTARSQTAVTGGVLLARIEGRRGGRGR